MHYEVFSDRQSRGSSSGESHRVVRVAEDRRLVVAVFRRRDMAEELCSEFNKPRGFIASERELLAAA